MYMGDVNTWNALLGKAVTWQIALEFFQINNICRCLEIGSRRQPMLLVESECLWSFRPCDLPLEMDKTFKTISEAGHDGAHL